MKKLLRFQALVLFTLLLVSPVFAATGDIGKIQTFIQSVIQTLVLLAGLVSAGFFVWGGFGYITSSGNPENLDKSKKTVLYSAIGLAIVMAAFVLSNVVSQIATSAFGTAIQ